MLLNIASYLLLPWVGKTQNVLDALVGSIIYLQLHDCVTLSDTFTGKDSSDHTWTNVDTLSTTSTTCSGCSKAKVHVFADSGLPRENGIEFFKASATKMAFSHRLGITGESVEFIWHIFPGWTSKQLLERTTLGANRALRAPLQTRISKYHGGKRTGT